MWNNRITSYNVCYTKLLRAGAVVFEDVIKKQESPKPSREEIDTEYYDVISPSQPNIKLLCNGEYTLALTDLGASIAMYQGKA